MLAKQPNEESDADRLANALRSVLLGGTTAADGAVAAPSAVALAALTKELKVMHHHIHELQAHVAVAKNSGNGDVDWKKFTTKIERRFDQSAAGYRRLATPIPRSVGCDERSIGSPV